MDNSQFTMNTSKFSFHSGLARNVFHIITLSQFLILLTGCGVYKNYERPADITTDGIYGSAQSGDSLGMGDLIVTCLSQHSRNRYVGEHIGRGETIEQVLAGMKMVAEGVPTCKSTKALADKLGVEMPIVNSVHALLFEGKKVEDVLKDMWGRELKTEVWG